jgi:hypothetical protein
MKWRVMLEVTQADGVTVTREVSAGSRRASDPLPETIGLTLAEGKFTLAGLPHCLVRMQADLLCRERRLCQWCGSRRPLKDRRSRRLMTVFGAVSVDAPRFDPCRCGVASRRRISPLAEVMPDRCTPEYERLLAKMGALAPYGRAVALMAEFLPLGDRPAVETARRRTLKVGAGLECASLKAQLPDTPEAKTIAVSVDGGHVKSIRSYQMRSFEILLAHASNDRGQYQLFSSVAVEADRERLQLGAVLRGLGATSATPVVVLTDGAEGPRSLGAAASPGPTRHVLDWFHLSRRVQHAAQVVGGWPGSRTTEQDQRNGALFAEAVNHIRWRLWHGQVPRALDLIGRTLENIESGQLGLPAAYSGRLTRVLRDLKMYVSGHSGSIINYAAARRSAEPISTAATESAVHRLVHRRMTAKQQMRWSPRGAHLMLKVRTAVLNATLERDHAAAERWARRPYRRIA